MTPEHAERLGVMADELDAILYSAKLPLPPQMHVDCLTAKVRETRDRLADVVRETTGQDPWATNPFQG